MVPVSMAVMLLLLCSCTSGTGEPQAQYPSNPPIGAVAVILKPEQVSRPIDSFYPTPDQIVHLAMARQEQMNHCLSAAGINQTFAYPPAPSITVFALTIAEDRVTRSSLWGFFDPANAAKYGYQHSAAAKTTLSIPPQTKEAQQKCPLTSSTTRDPLTFVFDWSLPDKGPPTPATDARFVRAVADWSTCMGSKGFNYKNPLEALGAFRSETSPSPRQTRTASADVACKIKSNFVGKSLAVQVTYDNLYIARDSARLAQFRAQFEQGVSASPTPRLLGG